MGTDIEYVKQQKHLTKKELFVMTEVLNSRKSRSRSSSRMDGDASFKEVGKDELLCNKNDANRPVDGKTVDDSKSIEATVFANDANNSNISPKSKIVEHEAKLLSRVVDGNEKTKADQISNGQKNKEEANKEKNSNNQPVKECAQYKDLNKASGKEEQNVGQKLTKNEKRENSSNPVTCKDEKPTNEENKYDKQTIEEKIETASVSLTKSETSNQLKCGDEIVTSKFDTLWDTENIADLTVENLKEHLLRDNVRKQEKVSHKQEVSSTEENKTKDGGKSIKKMKDTFNKNVRLVMNDQLSAQELMKETNLTADNVKADKIKEGKENTKLTESNSLNLTAVNAKADKIKEMKENTKLTESNSV